MAVPTAPEARRVAGAALASALRIVANIAVVLAFGLLAAACYSRFSQTGSMNALGLVVVNALFVCMYVARRDAKAIATAPGPWLLAFAGTTLPLLLRPAESPVLAGLGTGVQLVGLVLIVAAILSLRRSFGIVPANRGIRDGGLYRFVRHPLYAAELLFLAGFVLANPSPRNLALWALECALQLLRAQAEESFLSADRAYRAYLERVRYRLIPGLV